MTDEHLAELRALADAATSGPWKVSDTPLAPDFENAWVVLEDGRDGLHAGYDGQFSVADAAFIAASRTAIPELLDVIARVKKVLAEESFHADGITQSIEVVETSDLRAALDWTYVK